MRIQEWVQRYLSQPLRVYSSARTRRTEARRWPRNAERVPGGEGLEPVLVDAAILG
jgi:hypothetical protein